MYVLTALNTLMAIVVVKSMLNNALICLHRIKSTQISAFTDVKSKIIWLVEGIIKGVNTINMLGLEDALIVLIILMVEVVVMETMDCVKNITKLATMNAKSTAIDKYLVNVEEN